MESSARRMADWASLALRLEGPSFNASTTGVTIDIALCMSASQSLEDSQLNGTDITIRQLERLASGIDRALAALRSITDQDSRAVAAMSSAAPQRKQRRMSASARKRIGDAARKRWAALRAAQGSAKPATVKRRKRRLSPEGRQRIIEAAKRRWAAKRG